MKDKLEHVKIQLTKDNIRVVKVYGSFARVVNTLIKLIREDDIVREKFIKELNKNS